MKNKIILVLLCSVILSSCSKKTDESEVAADSANVSELSTDAQSVANESPVAADHEPETTPVTEQNPDVILTDKPNPVEKNRRMVREAAVNFTAKDVVKTALAIEKLTLESGGFIEAKNIDFNVVDLKSLKIADGKIKVFEKIEPASYMVIRVPSDKAANVVNQLLPLMYFLNQQQYSAKRYELRLLNEKIEQSQTVPSDTRNKQLNEIGRLTQMEVQDRVRFSTIQIHINQPTLVRERIDIDIDAVAHLNGDHFWKRAWNGIQYGWQFVLDLLVVLITIWPLYLLVIIGYVLFKLIQPFYNKLK